MPDQPERKGLTAEELDLLQRQAELNDGTRTSVWARSQLAPLVAMARLSITLQRRAEEAEALRLLQEWVARGEDEDRSFSVSNNGMADPWTVRLEDEPRSWSLEIEGCTLLPDAVRIALRDATKAGFE